MKYVNFMIFILIEAVPCRIKQARWHDSAIEPYYTSQDVSNRGSRDTET